MQQSTGRSSSTSGATTETAVSAQPESGGNFPKPSTAPVSTATQSEAQSIASVVAKIKTEDYPIIEKNTPKPQEIKYMLRSVQESEGTVTFTTLINFDPKSDVPKNIAGQVQLFRNEAATLIATRIAEAAGVTDREKLDNLKSGNAQTKLYHAIADAPDGSLKIIPQPNGSTMWKLACPVKAADMKSILAEISAN